MHYKVALVVALFGLSPLLACTTAKNKLGISLYPTWLWSSEKQRTKKLKKVNPKLGKMVENKTQDLYEAEKETGIQQKRARKRKLFSISLGLIALAGFAAYNTYPYWCSTPGFCRAADWAHPDFNYIAKSIINHQLDENELDRWLATGTSINTQNEKGATPLQIASYYGSPELVNLLIRKGANVTLPNHLGYTPLIGATVGNNTDIAEILINHSQPVDFLPPSFDGGCSPPKLVGISAQDYNNCTAMIYADTFDFTTIKQILKKKGLTLGAAICGSTKCDVEGADLKDLQKSIENSLM